MLPTGSKEDGRIPDASLVYCGLECDPQKLAHDLRQPLGVIIGYLSLLIDHPAEFDSADTTAMLHEMQIAAGRLDGMLDQLTSAASRATAESRPQTDGHPHAFDELPVLPPAAPPSDGIPNTLEAISDEEAAVPTS